MRIEKAPYFFSLILEEPSFRKYNLTVHITIMKEIAKPKDGKENYLIGYLENLSYQKVPLLLSVKWIN